MTEAELVKLFDPLNFPKELVVCTVFAVNWSREIKWVEVGEVGTGASV